MSVLLNKQMTSSHKIALFNNRVFRVLKNRKKLTCHYEKIKIYLSSDSLPIKQFESGTWVDEISRPIGIFQATFFNWKKKYGSMSVSELHKLRQLEVGKSATEEVGCRFKSGQT